MLVWLGVCAVFAFAAAWSAWVLGVAPVATAHIAFAFGVMPLVLGAILHFVPVLTRGAAAGAALRGLPLPAQLAGGATVLALAGMLPYAALHAAATMASLIALLLAMWTLRRLRRTLGAPHPGTHWYGAALLCLFFAVSCVPLWLALPDLRHVLRLFHLHLNMIGFIGLAALGTLPVLLPTALGQADARAAAHLRRMLLPAAGGVLMIAAGSAGAFWLAACGALLLVWVVARLLAAWWRAHGASLGSAATAPLLAATGGLLLLLLAGIAHGAGWMPAPPALAAFVAIFLMPLVTGALAQLLPVWRYPGPDSPHRRGMNMRLVAGGRLRAALFFVGGLLLLIDHAGGLLLAAAGLLHFALTLIAAFWLDSTGTSDDNPPPSPPPSFGQS